MRANLENWMIYTNPKLPMRLEYPDPTPLGYPVIIREIEAIHGYRAHLVSDGSDEIYFEVGRYPDLPPQQAIDAFLEDVTGRIDHLKSSKVAQISFAGSPAYRFNIQWPGKEREILFVERADALYRVIHDPASSINQGMLESLVFLPVL
jgi:hypothetical protein